MKQIDRTKGFIALTSVLVVSVIMLSVFVGATSRSISGLNVTSALSSSLQAEALARTCAEYALLELERTLDYAGDESLAVAEGSCDILPVLGSGNTNRTVEAESTVSNTTRRVKVVVSQISPELNISSWNNVAEF